MNEVKDVLEVLAKLPEMCATLHPTTGEPIILKRGSVGYWPFPALARKHWGETPAEGVAKFNARHNVTPAQKDAMEIGSHFGFDVPGADPDNHGK